eukprot:TRINITY_DN113018_c0_g1_i1.p1 TRINITY_DN113018_c0_g1~~TRINITY_DN113018_c0_g1_i1.p1  ORF type:complete len:276 (+),score=150.92 TRINITY_DN113018_c0_g1_i1:45-830(+)
MKTTLAIAVLLSVVVAVAAGPNPPPMPKLGTDVMKQVGVPTHTVVKTGDGKGNANALVTEAAPVGGQAPAVDVPPMHAVDDDGDAADEAKKDQELQEALQTVKDQIVAKATQIKSEKAWVKQVVGIIEAYALKVRRVNQSIRSLQENVKELYKNKKQIENMILQRKLQKRLSLATKDLDTLQNALQHLQKKRVSFTQSGSSLKNTIGEIQAELQRLRSEHPAPAEESSEEGSEESSEAAAESGASEESSKKMEISSAAGKF